MRYCISPTSISIHLLGIGWGMGVVATSGLGAGPGAINPFTEEGAIRGLSYVMQGWPQAYGYYGFGCGFVDLDGDGDPDVILMGAADGRVGIMENDGTGNFVDRSKGSGIPLLMQGSAFAAGDFDGDGWPDLYFTQFGEPNVLMKNLGNFQFSEVSVTAGVGDSGAGKGACFGDYDNDGWLDLYVCNYQDIIPGPSDITNRLFHNLGDGTFADVSAAQGVDDEGEGFQPVWSDYDRDGDVDLYLSNDNRYLPVRANRLWRNDGGVLVDVSAASGAGVALFSMGMACGDFDGNGRPDFYCTNIPGGGGMNNPLLLNQADGTFVESSVSAGVDNPFTSWGAVFADFTNNGHQDLYVNNMMLPNTLYLNSGVFPCVEAAGQANLMASGGNSFSSAAADVDGDGDLDLLVNNLSGNVQLFINHEGDTRSWLRVQVVGRQSNLQAVGANVSARFGADWQFREVLAGGNGYLGQNELTVHFGAGAGLMAAEVVVQWPGGSPVRTLTNLPTNQVWTAYPPERLGDGDGDGLVNLNDFLAFSDCFASGFQPGCEMMDFDGDSVVGLGDFAAFLAVYSPPVVDCNVNGTPDLEEILLDPTLDWNRNGVLAGCEVCPADCVPLLADGSFGNGVVSIDDLVAVLNGFGGAGGSCDTAPPGGNGTINIDDLVAVLNAFGPCP